VDDGGGWTLLMQGETIESLKGLIEEQKEDIRFQRKRISEYVEPAEYRKEFD
jgi:hypothetical protein